jgi:uncharacterized protein (DUF433 family)
MRKNAFNPESDVHSYGEAGIYLPLEVSSYLLAAMPADVQPPTSRRVLRWIRYGLLAPERRRAAGRDIVIDFEDLVTCQAITLLRRAGCSLAAILAAERYFSKLYGTRKPFAHHKLWYSPRDVYGKAGQLLVSGSLGGQIAFDFLFEWLERLNDHLDFSTMTGTATYWQPTEGISLKPAVQFGQPCLDRTRIPTRSIWGYIAAGDSPRFIAESYGIEVSQVEQAVGWEERVRSALEAPTALSA